MNAPRHRAYVCSTALWSAITRNQHTRSAYTMRRNRESHQKEFRAHLGRQEIHAALVFVIVTTGFYSKACIGRAPSQAQRCATGKALQATPASFDGSHRYPVES